MMKIILVLAVALLSIGLAEAQTVTTWTSTSVDRGRDYVQYKETRSDGSLTTTTTTRDGNIEHEKVERSRAVYDPTGRGFRD